MNGTTGPNGQGGPFRHNGHAAHNGHAPLDRLDRGPEMPAPAGSPDDGEGEAAGPIPSNWRAERLNGGVDTTPHEPFRPESRGEVGSLIDALHELFAQDRSVASRGDSTRCGVCYLHFPLTALEYRESEGFYVCAGCKRSLGHYQLPMVRRQQSSHGS